MPSTVMMLKITCNELVGFRFWICLSFYFVLFFFNLKGRVDNDLINQLNWSFDVLMIASGSVGFCHGILPPLAIFTT